MGEVYNEWWRGKHRDFLVHMRDKLRSIRPDLQLYYYNWDSDDWNIGPIANNVNQPEDWSDYYNIDRARLWHERIRNAQRALKDTDYVRQLTSFAEPHWILRPGDGFRDTMGRKSKVIARTEPSFLWRG